MKFFKTKVEKLQSKISEKNLNLLDVSEQNSEYSLGKLLAWQDEFDWVDWKVFSDEWLYCNRCKG